MHLVVNKPSLKLFPSFLNHHHEDIGAKICWDFYLTIFFYLPLWSVTFVRWINKWTNTGK